MEIFYIRFFFYCSEINWTLLDWTVTNGLCIEAWNWFLLHLIFVGLRKWHSQHRSPLHYPKTGSSCYLSPAVVPVCTVCDCCRGGSCCRSVLEMIFIFKFSFFFLIQYNSMHTRLGYHSFKYSTIVHCL